MSTGLARAFLAESEHLTHRRPTIAKLNFSHEAIARWLLENPDSTLGDCARHFGYTQAWLSIIIHSDAFRMHYEKLNREADELVVSDIPAKMRGVASLALDGLADQVESAVADKTVAHRQFLLQTSEALLSKLGYGQAKSQVVVNPRGGNVSVTVVDNSTLERARARLTSARANEATVVEGEARTVSDPAT